MSEPNYNWKLPGTELFTALSNHQPVEWRDELPPLIGANVSIAGDGTGVMLHRFDLCCIGVVSAIHTDVTDGTIRVIVDGPEIKPSII